MNEFRIWTDTLEKSVVVHNFHLQHSMLRVSMIEEWHAKGGILLIGDRAFANISREKVTLKNRILKEVRTFWHLLYVYSLKHLIR
jgi:hypothetical protein